MVLGDPALRPHIAEKTVASSDRRRALPAGSCRSDRLSNLIPASGKEFFSSLLEQTIPWPTSDVALEQLRARLVAARQEASRAPPPSKPTPCDTGQTREGFVAL